LYTKHSSREDWLDQYSSVFGTAEGNSTFYGLPELETVQRWCHHTRSGFRFAFKFPRELTHDRMLIGGESTLARFLEILGILHDKERLGPSLLQLSPKFDGSRLNVLEHFLGKLPTEFPIAVEVRHSDYFDGDKFENGLNRMLADHQLNRVMFDSRALFSQPPDDEIEEVSQKRKPQLPHRCIATGFNPMLRLVGRNDLAKAQPWIDEWTGQVAAWIREGRQPFVFTHAPDDQFAPPMAEIFHRSLREKLPQLAPLPRWPGRDEPRQLKLF
jgi:uncharacterized protein YecE (DUF72 family)